jgi:hypothetical protein
MWEAWLKVCANNELEAIQNKVQKKGLADYEALMTVSVRATHLEAPGECC